MLVPDMQLISKLNKGFRFLLCVIDIYRYLYLQLLMLFKNESNPKPIKISEDKFSEFYNKSMKSWLEKVDIEMYSPHN